MVIDTIEELDKVWAQVKTSGTDISGPPEVLKEARRRVLEETRNPYFRSSRRPNLNYSGVKENGEKIMGSVYCPYTRHNKIRGWLEEGLGIVIEGCKEFTARSSSGFFIEHPKKS